MLPPMCQRRRPEVTDLSRLDHTASTLAVYASQLRFTALRGSLHHARLASDWSAPLSGGIRTHRALPEGFSCLPFAVYIASSFTRLGLAHWHLYGWVGGDGRMASAMRTQAPRAALRTTLHAPPHVTLPCRSLDPSSGDSTR
jgi:hypothetical protein